MNNIITFDPRDLSVAEIHGYLLAAVAPRPIALASTIDQYGKTNLSPFSFFNVFSANPPVMIFSPARRGRDNTTKHTYENILEVPEVVINVVSHSMVEQVSLASSEFPKGMNEFEKAGLTEISSINVKPPRVGESPVSFECRVQQVIPLGSEGGAGNLIISEVTLIHIQSKYLVDGKLDTTKLDLVGRMGGNWYTRASEESLFQVAKPSNAGVGIDNLPRSIRNSSILTGNNLGRLGGAHQLPKKEVVDMWMKDPDNARLLKKQNPVENLHQDAKRMLEKNNVDQALLLLMVANSLAN